MLSSIRDLEAPPGTASRQDGWDAVQTAVQRYVRGRSGRHDIADDIAQETVARLVELGRTQQIGSIFALAFRIADNLMTDMHRREKRLSDEVDTEWQSDEPSLDRVLDSRRAVDVFNRCLRRMPPLRREVLIRRRLNQESCRTIGEDLAISAKAVEKHITRGMIDLRKALEQAGVDLVGQD
ncbi:MULTISPECIES: RNA polymerase sigma factor [unclassified Novosphingobium]|uniref:RNA polymerase sigma factor n=1 Tax=unclassified Novosphingobium TaxID=2644732 RepID=UPI00135A51EE|nr:MULTISPECIES: RNA polymerase sigma factor [unclassified Novosphingobium]